MRSTRVSRTTRPRSSRWRRRTSTRSSAHPTATFPARPDPWRRLGTVASTNYPNNLGTFLGNNGGRSTAPPGNCRVRPTTGRWSRSPASPTARRTRRCSASGSRGSSGRASDGLHQTYWLTSTKYTNTTTALNLISVVAECQASKLIFQETAGTNWDSKGEYWILDTCGTGGCYSHVNMPNKKACYFSGDTTGSTFRSLVGPARTTRAG